MLDCSNNHSRIKNINQEEFKDVNCKQALQCALPSDLSLYSIPNIQRFGQSL